jgi:hypothetical protein
VQGERTPRGIQKKLGGNKRRDEQHKKNKEKREMYGPIRKTKKSSPCFSCGGLGYIGNPNDICEDCDGVGEL